MNYRSLRAIWKYLREIKSLIRLALPIMAGMVSQTLMGIADTVMVGQVGVTPLAASSLVMNLYHLPMVFGFGMLSAVSILAANAFGAKDFKETGRVFRASSWLTLWTGIPLVLILMSLRWALPYLGQPDDVVEASGSYLWYIAPSLFPMLVALTGKQYCESLNHPWIPTLLMLGSVLLNVFLNWLLIYGHWGFPEMGLDGAGLATLLARTVSAILIIGWILWAKEIQPYRQGIWGHPDDHAVLKKLFQLGLPVAFQLLLEMGAFAFAALMLGWIGANAMAAHQIAFTCASTTFMFSLSFGLAASVRVGQALGAGLKRRVRRIGTIGFCLSSLVMGIFACVFIFGGEFLASKFVESGDVRQLAVKLLVIAAVFQIFDGIQVTAISLLRGMQDVNAPAIVAIVAYWVVTVPLGYFLAFQLERGAVGIWIGFAAGLGVAALCLTGRFYYKSMLR